MRRFASILTLLGIGLISLLGARPVLAFPSLPSSFYGTVKVNGANVPDGTLVQASMYGKIITEIQTQTYQGDSFYSLDVPGDDPDTLVVEGGQDGDTIIFIIGGIAADQVGIWKSGTFIALNLSTSSAATLVPAQPILTLVPTETAIILMAATATPLAMETQSIPTSTVLNLGPSLPTAGMPTTPTIPVATNLENTPTVSSTTNLSIGIVIAGFILFIILFTILWVIIVRKPKVE
jgi:hypothetical protein